MPVPDPKIGMVVKYGFLWAAEHAQGLEEGRKDRPCIIVGAQENPQGGTTVYVVPLTHSPPQGNGEAVEMPAQTKQRLGLDADASWVVCNEMNKFTWPGFDLRPIRPNAPGRGNDYTYGSVAGKFLQSLRENVNRAMTQNALRMTPRDPRQDRPAP